MWVIFACVWWCKKGKKEDYAPKVKVYIDRDSSLDESRHSSRRIEPVFDIFIDYDTTLMQSIRSVVTLRTDSPQDDVHSVLIPPSDHLSLMQI